MVKYRRLKYKARRFKKSMGRPTRRGVPKRKSGSIAQRLRKLERSIKPLQPIHFMRQGFSATLSSTGSLVPLTRYDNLTPVFGNAPEPKESARHVSVGMDVRFDMANEVDPVRYTVFIVSLKDIISPAWNSTTGNVTLIADEHYSLVDGMAMLNKEYFNIHKIKRFSTGNDGYSVNANFPNLGFVNNVPGEQGMRRQHRFYMKQKINKIVKDAGGSWVSLQTNPDPSRNFYMIIFNNNSALDLQNPTFEFHGIHTLQSF